MCELSYAHRKGQKEDAWLDDEITLFLQFLTTSRPFRFLFLFVLPSFFLCPCWPNYFVSVTNFLKYFDPRILFNPENLLTFYNGFFNRGNDPNSPDFKV
jgi:hypothetical protein